MNKLLLRQIQKHFKDPGNLPPDVASFVKVVNESYNHYEKDRNMLERSVDLSSVEMIELNSELRKEKDDLNKIHGELKTIFNTIDEVLFSVDMTNGKLIQISPACEKVYGYEAASFLSNPDLWMELILPEDIGFINENDPLLRKGETVASIYRIKHKNGSIRWVETKVAPTLNAEGQLIRLDGFTLDITEKKNAEIERETITLQLNQRNKDLEQFAYIISHNLRTPMTNILGLANIILSVPLSEEDNKKCLGGLKNAVGKLDEIIHDLNYILQVRQELVAMKESVSFSQLVNDIKMSISNLIEQEEVTIKTDFNDVDEIFAVKSYVNSIFYNLILNSIKYRTPNKLPVIEIISERTDDMVRLRFRDNGLGIDLSRHKGKIFGLYSKFHPHKEGKGMGLYMTKTQVEILGGKISVNSEVNKGTEFLIELNS